MKYSALVLVLAATAARAQPAPPTTPVPAAPSTPAPAPAAPAASPPAPEDPAIAHAKQLYLEGKRYYDVADYPHAIAAWKQAYVISSAPMLLFNLGQAYRLSGDCASALRFYANYEREAGKGADLTEVNEAKARCNPQPTNANPPPGYPSQTAAAAGEARVLPGPPTLRDTGGGKRIAGIAVGATGLALVGVGIYLATVASNDAQQVGNFRGEWTTAQRSTEQDGQHAATWSVVSTSVGIAGVAAGAALYVLGARAHGVDVAVTPSTTEVTWSAAF